jgi:glycosyltransferase involved in cell wall biosynthesis
MKTPAEPIRVLVFTHSAARDRLLNALFDHTDRQAVNYSVVTMLREPGPLLEDMKTRSVNTWSLGLCDGSLESLPAALFRLRAVLRRARPDLVHSVLFYPGLALEILRSAQRESPPSLHARHHNVWTESRYPGVHDRLSRWTARHATQLLAVSEAVRCTLLAAGVPQERISVVHNGFDWDHEIRANPEACAEWRERLPGRPLLVAAGRLLPQKDYPTLLAAHHQIVQRYPDALLAVAGTGPQGAQARLEDTARKMGLAGSIRFLGWVEHIYDLIGAADVFVQSSRDESFSQTLVEAMGLGVPIAATTPGAAAEVVGTWYEALEIGDPPALARRVTDTITRLEEAQSRAQGVAGEVRSRYSAERMATGYQVLYERLAQGRVTKAKLAKAQGTGTN